ncbi:MAG TPA: hypothetical protein VFQ88_15240 [Nevskiaceae bacterium]|nr:hypothetical protein [Nevskiaceae bacterium]
MAPTATHDTTAVPTHIKASKQDVGSALGAFRARALQHAITANAPDDSVTELLAAVTAFGERVGASDAQCHKAVKRTRRAWYAFVSARRRAETRAQRALEPERCDLCGQLVPRGELTKEHLKPRALLKRGHPLPHDANVILTCQPMNAWLGARTAEHKLGAAFHVALNAEERALCRSSPIAALRAVRARTGRDASCPRHHLHPYPPR